jgi:hypothetical protein
MKRIPILILAATLFAGCSEPIAVQVTYTATSEPVADVLVRRRRPVNRWEKITNPIGATYHTLRVAETCWTDSEGLGTLQKARDTDVYDLVTTSSVPLTAEVGRYSMALDPGTNTHLSALHYFAKRENGKWKIAVGEPWWKWKKD